MDNLTGGVHDDHGACQQTSQGAVHKLYAEVLTEGGAESGGGDDVLNALGCAEAADCEGQVVGDAQHDGVLQACSLLVEGADAGCAHTGVDGGEDVQHQVLTCEICGGDLGEISRENREFGQLCADCGQVAVGVDYEFVM